MRERGIRSRSDSSSRSRSNLRVSTNRDKVRCFKCREYDHFANECPNLVIEDSDRESDSARQASLQILADSDRFRSGTIFKHMKGRNGSTSFLLLHKKGGLIKNVSLEKYLTEDQTKYIYDKVELGDKIKVKKVSQEIWNKTLPQKRSKEKEEINLYEKVLVSDINTLDKNKSQREQWSILSDNIIYVRSVSYDEMNRVDIKMVDYRDDRKMYKKMGKEEGQMMNIDFGEGPDVLKAKYMDVYEGVFAEVVTK